MLYVYGAVPILNSILVYTHFIAVKSCTYNYCELHKIHYARKMHFVDTSSKQLARACSYVYVYGLVYMNLCTWN